MHLLTPASAQHEVEAFGGGKALNLYRLANAEVSVPRWAALGTDVFDYYLRVSAGIDADIAAESAVGGVDDDARALADAIKATEVDDRVRSVIEAAYAGAGRGCVCVRSSGAEEDTSARSFAGQFESYMNLLSLDEVIAAVRLCWASVFSERAIAYRAANQLAEVKIAVIVQTMIPADRSGVLFTANPVTGEPGEAVISAVYGLGEGLVSGSVDADNITVDRRTRTIVNSRVGAKQTRIDKDPGRPGCRTRAVDEVMRNTLALSPDEISELIRVGDRVAELLGGEQDIEWAYADDGELWVLQSRPITTLQLAAAPTGTDASSTPEIWDNSSASENFGDVTTPLTYSFVSHVTHEIYREHFHRLWVPYAELHEMDGWLRAMFGYFNGRMYNNLTNWVRVNRLLPFSALRRSVMHAAMGLTGPIERDIIDRAEPFESVATGRGRVIRAVVAARFAWRFATVGLSVRRFLKRFEAESAKLDVDYSAWRSDDIYRLFKRVDNRLVREFGSALFLHPAISLAVGGLQRLTSRWLPEAPSWFPYQAATPSGGIASVEPAERLIALTAMVSESSLASDIVLNAPHERARHELLEAGANDIVAAIDGYVEDFGYRSINELKLEEPCLRERPQDFFAILADSLRAAQGMNDTADGSLPFKVDDYLREHLSLPKRAVYAVVRGNARRLLRARERVRFCRTRAFGVVRTMMLAIGEDLTNVGALDAPRDVFYLRLDEVRACYEAGLYPSELKAAVAARRCAEDRYRTMRPPRRFETRGPVYWRNDVAETAWASVADHAPTEDVRELSGVPCCPGIVEGEVRLMDTPGNAQGGIVATYRTDPGWATVLPSAAALLVEIGSPLNHVAIVARELSVPTIVQIQGLTRTLRTGMRVRIDGGAGTVTIIESNTEGD